jgi:hypothetical protein
MNKTRTLSLLMAGLLAGAGAYAQVAGSTSATSDVPVTAGEHSTVTHGQPNMATTNQPGLATTGPAYSASGVPVDSASSTSVMGASAAPAGSYHGAREVPRNGAAVTSNIPVGAGEASTMTNGVPNLKTNNEVVNDTRIVSRAPAQVDLTPSGEASTIVNGRINGNPDDPLLRR